MIVQSGQYAVVDPESPSSLLYLKKREFLKLTQVALSTDSKLTVLAVPYDSRPKDDEIEAPKPENSPPVKTVGHAIFWRGMLSRISRSYRAFLSRESKMFDSKKIPLYLTGLVKRWSLAVGHWSSLPLTTQSWFKDIVSVLPHLQHVLKVQGTTGLVLRLKISMLLIQQYLAGSPLGPFAFGYGVAVKHGLPAWLPLGARAGIRARSHRVIRFWISILYIYKVIEMPHKVRTALKTIQAAPFVSDSVTQALLAKYRTFLRTVFIPKVLGGVRPIPEGPHRFTVFTPVSAGPNGSPAINKVDADAAALVAEHDASELSNKEKVGSGKTTFDTPGSILECIATVGQIFGLNVGFSQVYDLGKNYLNSYEEKLAKATSEKEKPRRPLHSRVHVLGEPAGKLRPIAILDIFTQRVLKPLHDDIYAVLKSLPQDGTHSQSRLMAWLKTKANTAWKGFTWSSLDISAATDSIPVILYKILLEELYGATSDAIELAECVILLMTNRDYTVTVDKSVNAPRKESESLPPTVRYTRGQPMGCLASFALLAIWNHSWVQFASWLVSGKLCFTYGVTGDDVVISEPNKSSPVGNKYAEISNLFGIGISATKSYVSSTLFNFLSRTWMDGEEISPASIREDVHIRDTSTRTQRALRLLERDWWNVSSNGWLAKAMKYFLYPSEFIIASCNARRGKLDGYGLRAVLAFLSPSSSITRTLGISGVPVFSWLSAFAGSTALLAHGDLVRKNLLLPQGSNPAAYYPMLQDLANLILRRICEIGEFNTAVLGQYRNFVAHQKPELQGGIGCMFLPSSSDLIQKRIGDQSWLYPAIEQGNNTIGLVSRLGDQWWTPQNIEESLVKLFNWLQEFPKARDYSDPELFAHQASLWQSSRRVGEREFNNTERTMLSLLYLMSSVHPTNLNLRLNAEMTDYLERKFLDRFLGYTVAAGDNG